LKTTQKISKKLFKNTITLRSVSLLRIRREITSGFWVIGLQRRELLLGMSEGHPKTLEELSLGSRGDAY